MKIWKKTLSCFLALVMSVCLLPVTALAAGGDVAEMNGTTYTSLDAAVADVPENGTATITLLGDASSSISIMYGENITLDLGGNTLTGSISIYRGSLTLKNGTLKHASQAINIYGSSADGAAYSSLTVAEDATVDAFYAVILREAKNTKVAYGSQIDIYGTLNGNLWVMGNIQNDLTAASNPSTIHFHDGAAVNVETDNGTAVALNGAAKMTIDKATITGGTGVEVRAGELVVNGATIVGTATPTEVSPNGNGTTTLGAGVAVAQHSTKLPISVTINSGSISGHTAFYESNPQENDEEFIEKIVLHVAGGEYTAINGGTNAVYSDTQTGFITGGSFSTSVEEYVIDSLNWEANDGMYTYHATQAEAAAAAGQDGSIREINKETPPQPGTDYYTVTLDANGGYSVPGSFVGVAGETFTLPTPTRRGYYFLGWSDGRNLYQGGDVYTVTGNATLTAQWISISGAAIAGEAINGLTSQVQSPFVDVNVLDYYYDAVNWAVDQGITTGTGRLSFSPDEPCTRAQAVTFLWRAAGSPAPKSNVTAFADVDSSAYYAKAVAWAVENGVTNGTSATTFSPSATCTRAQIVTFLYRAFGKSVNASVPFTDVAASAYFAPAVAWAAANNVTGGTTPTTFSPAATCTRAQIVTFLYRACK